MSLWVSSAILAVIGVVVTGRTLDLQNSHSVRNVNDVPVQCVFCQVAMYAFEKDVVPTVKSEKDMEDLVTNLCLRIPGNITTPDQCAKLGKQVGDLLWLSKLLTAKQACQMLKVCPVSQSELPEEVQIFYNALSSKNNSLECSACKDIVGAVKVLILDNEQWIEREVDSLFCDELPPDASAECKKAIDDDLPALLDQYLDPQLICGYVQLC